MKLWIISQDEYSGYDTFDSAVVAAESEDDAKNMYPGTGKPLDSLDGYRDWTSHPDAVSCEFIGEAKEGTLKSVICASFNAG